MAADRVLMLATDVVQAPNDKQQLESMLGKIAALPEEFGKVSALLVDNGCFSEEKLSACVAAMGDPVIAMEARRIACTRRKARNSTPCANRSPNRCSHHQIGARIPLVFAARTQPGARRVALRDPGLRHLRADGHLARWAQAVPNGKPHQSTQSTDTSNPSVF